MAALVVWTDSPWWAMMVQEVARTTIAPSLPCSKRKELVSNCFLCSRHDPGLSAYLLAVQTALVGLDGDELVTTKGESVGEGVIAGAESCSKGVDLVLGELKPDDDVNNL